MKKLITLLLVLVMALSLAACGDSQTADTGEEPQEAAETTEAVETTQETEEENGDKEIEFDTPIVLMDNDFCKVAATSKYEKHGTNDYLEIGYKLYMENKLENTDISLTPREVSVDGFVEGFYFSQPELGHGKKANNVIFCYNTSNQNNNEFKSIDELTNVEIVWDYYFSETSTPDFIYQGALSSDNILP